MKAYHFVGNTLKDGRPVPKDGKLLKFDGEPIPCTQGLHASQHPFDALRYAPGPILCLVELGGKIIHDGDKLAATERTILARFDATEMLRYFGRMRAISVLHLCNEVPPDAVLDYLMTGDMSIRAATWNAAPAAAPAATWNAEWDAAWAATWNAVRFAARSAAPDAVCDAARSAARYAARYAAWGAARAAAPAAAWNAAPAAAPEAVWNAEWNAAWNAAWKAAWNAAWDATWNAAWKAARDEFKALVDEQFR